MGLSTLGAVSAGTSLLGSAMGAAGQAGSANASAAQASYQSQMALRNQQIAQQNAQLAIKQGDADAGIQTLKTGQAVGSQRASMAAQGGDVNSGSNLDLQGDTLRAGEYNAAKIRSDAAWKAYGYDLQASGLGAEAANYATQSSNATSNSAFNIGSSLLGGVSSVAGKWDSWQDKTPKKPTSGEQPGPIY